MLIRSIIAGIVSTGLLLALLVLSRVLGSPKEAKVELVEVNVMEYTDPTPPPELSEPEDPEETPPPPAPRIDAPVVSVDVDVPVIALSLNKLNLTTPIDAFHTDNQPASLPKIVTAAPKTPPKKVSYTPKKGSPPVSRIIPKRTMVVKSRYEVEELDSKPRVIRTGSFSWPRSASGTSGRVVISLEISEKGYVKVLNVISSSDTKLNAAATKVARGSRFTPPMKNGVKVKARYNYTFNLKKP